jgi:hypothetical protein
MNHLILLNSKLENAANATSNKALKAFCKSYSTAVIELLEALDKLKMYKGNEKWKSIKKAL